MTSAIEKDAHVQDLLPAYAVGCLDEDEVLEVTAHLQACPSCREELEAYDQVTDLLPLAVQEVAPRPALRDRVLKEVRSQIESDPTQTAPGARRFDAFLRRSMPAWGALGLILIVALAAVNLLLWDRLGDLSRPATTLQTIVLQPEERAPGATGLMVVGGDGRVGTLVVDRLPPLAEGQEYQLWMILDGVRKDGGVFSVSEGGYGVKYIHAPDPLLSYSAFGVTVEPEGGSPEPTGVKVLGVDR